MPDLPGVESWATGGIVGLILIACATLIKWFRSATEDGETLAEQRISALLADFEGYRDRTRSQEAITDAEIRGLRSELIEARMELAAVMSQLRKSETETHALQLHVTALTDEVYRARPPTTQ